MKDYLHCKINKKIRLLFNHEGIWRHILRFSVSRDGSFYLSPGYKNNIMVSYDSKQSDQASVHFDYDDAKYVQNKQDIEKAHLSYHASGEIHMHPQIFYGPSLSTLNKQILFCQVAFEHPYNYPVVNNKRKTDVFLKDSIEENSFLQCQIFVAPKNNWQKIVHLNYDSQDNGIFCFSKLDNAPDLIYQIVLGSGPKGDWPQGTTIVATGSEIKSKSS